jgi:CBS domain-containing protein
VSEDTPLITVLNVMVEHGVSFVPVISAEGEMMRLEMMRLWPC